MKTHFFRWPVVSFFFLMVILSVPAQAATYDFASLGAASGGFKPQGNRFLVSETFTNDGTSMYYNDSVNSTVNGMIIKPDGTNLSSFDLGNMTISPYGGSYTVSITVNANLKAGGPVSQTVSNYSLTAATSLTTMGMNFSAFNDVTQLSINLTVASSQVWNINFDNITITDEQAPVVLGAEPTTQATNLKAASKGATQLNIYWQNGNGARRVVFAKQGNAGTPTVTDGAVYTANADFSAAADIGGGWKCVYRDTGRVLSITGLAANTEYRLVVYEFNGTGGGENYLTSTGTNIINHTTSPAGLDKKDFGGLGAASGGFKPQGSRYLVSDLFLNDVTSMYYNSTNASVSGIIIKPNNTSLLSFDLTDLEFSPYSADRTVTVTVTATLKSGGPVSQTINNFTMYQGIPYSLALMGMDFSAFIGVTQLSFSITTDSVNNINFSNITIANPDEYIAGTEPTTQASNLRVASCTTTGMDTYWTNGNGTKRIMFVKAGNSGTPTVTDGTVYTANADFSAAADIGGGWKCVYKGTERYVVLSGLTAGTEYRLAVYEFDGSGGGENYLTTTGTNIINHSTDPAGLVKYDFSALGAASGGFKPQGNRFLVSDLFTQDNTSMFYNSANPTMTGIVIKPDGTNLSSFDLKDMEFSPYNADRTISMTVTADLSVGGPVSQTISNFTMINGLSYSLALLGVNFSTFVGVTELRFDITVTGDKVYDLDFDNITISVGHTVTYDGNTNTGGAVPTDGNSYANGDTVTVLGNTGALVKTGYTFSGWNTAANGSGTAYAGGDTFAMGSSDITLYAQWTPIDYTVTYNGNTNTGGAVPTDGTTYHITDTVTVLGNTGSLVKTGYTFAGWNTAANGSGTSYSTGNVFAMGSSNVTLYAQWTENTYSVTYNGNSNTGGAVPTDATSYHNGDTATVLGNTGTLVRTGYTFAGWNTAANGSGTSYTGGDTFGIGLSNVTLYAQWTAVNYTVTYNGNTNTGGSVPTDGNTYHITDTVTVLGNTGTLVKTGYTFAGWNTAANGSGTGYSGGNTFAMGSSNVTLYAQWTENTYSVTYNGNGNTGGAVPTDATSYHNGDTATVLGNTGTLVRTGYTFAGWNTAANGSGTSYTGGDTFGIGLSDVTLYAQWTAVNYTVTYNGNTNTGGSVPTDGNTYHITDTVTVLGNTGSLVKTGYTFAGWNTAANGSGTGYAGGNTFAMGSSNVTLYAQWTQNPYSVTYNGNTNTGGTAPTDATVYHYGDTATVLGNTGALVKTGYTFAGWNTAANGSGTSYTGGDTFAIGLSDVTLYAQWTAVDYTVTYNGNTNTGGAAPTDGNIYHITDTVTVLGNTGALVKTGYTFAGWNTAANGSGTGYAGGNTFAMGSSNVVLYAQWTAIPYTVTYNGNTSSGGAVPVDGNTYHITDTVTVLGNTGPLVKTGYTFTGWNTAADGSGTGYAGGDTFAMGSSDVVLYAQWTINHYTLTVNSGVGDGVYPFQDVVTIAADVPPAGQVFDQWTGDTASVANIFQPNTTVTIPDADQTVTATFKDQGILIYALTVTSGSGSGNYLPGEEISLSADAPPAGQVFDQWTGDTAFIANINLPDTTFIMPAAAASVTATYKAQGAITYHLTVTSGTGSGDYLPGEVINLSADAPPAGQVFDQWTGDTASIANINLPDTTFIMPAAAASVTGTYKAQGAATYTLTVTDGTGSGNYLPGDIIAISATVPVGYTFERWTGQTAWVVDTAQADTTLTMPAADIAVDAVVNINTYTLAYAAGAHGALIGNTLQTVSYGSDGTAVTAVSFGGYHFLRWDDGNLLTTRTDVNVTADIAVTALFAVDTFTLEYTAGDHGTISGITPQTVSYGADGAAVTAMPDPGWHFVQWNDGSTDNPRADTGVAADIAVTALFAVNTYTLEYTAGANGSITGEAYQTVNRGEDGSNVTAVPDAGYHFVQWSDGVTAPGRTDTNVAGDIAVTAQFAADGIINPDIPADLDLDGNGIPDRVQVNIRVVADNTGRYYFGVVIPDEIVLDYLEWIDASTVPDMTNRPDEFPLGLVTFRITTLSAGDTIELTIYCSEPIPEGTFWYRHDPVNGWVDYSAYTVISDDRMSLTLTLQDGGPGDDDGMANGVIEGTYGPALFNGDDGGDDDDDDGGDNNHHGGGGGSCFISTAGGW
ncbi:MAG: InlB B-repeat-containing protein [Thermodesulfobacteriota bacterium]